MASARTLQMGVDYCERAYVLAGRIMMPHASGKVYA